MEDKALGAGQEQITDPADGAGEQQTKTFTQEQVNAFIAKERAKFAKKYEDLGDLEELRELKSQAAKAKEEAALRRGEFDRVLQEKLSAKDQRIQALENDIREYKIDTPLLQAAAEFKTVNPDQVRALLKGQIKLNELGEAEVIDQKGVTRYDDKGIPLTVRDLVKQFVDSNPHFALPNPAGANGKSSLGAGSKDVDVSKMSNEEYKAYRKSMGYSNN